MSLLVWVVTYFALYFGVWEPVAGAPEGFLETLGAVAVCWIAAEIVQGIFDAITGRS